MGDVISEAVYDESVPFLYCRKIKVNEVKAALGKMKCRKAVDPDSIPIDVWKCIGEIGLIWLTKLFNKILGSQRMPEDWRKSIILALIFAYKQRPNSTLFKLLLSSQPCLPLASLASLLSPRPLQPLLGLSKPHWGRCLYVAPGTHRILNHTLCRMGGSDYVAAWNAISEHKS